jgi:valyl-tRNA synthetase
LKLKPFSIVLPPPNVTGTLHMGHAFNTTLQDILIKFKKLQGYDVRWQAGIDHAGIATQMVVERQLKEKGLSRKEIGREDFIKLVWQWKEKSGGMIFNQLERLGLSLDFNDIRFTMDDKMSLLVRDVFIKLYEEGLIYKDKRLVNWDPFFETAISDLEVVTKEEKTNLYYIPYKFEDDLDNFIIIATTRPETIFADSAVAVNPNDDRYKDIIGKKVLVPIINKPIPIIADEYADKEKGSGAVKITPAHDFNDFEVGIRHNLEMINILDSKGNLNKLVPEKFQALNQLEARDLILNDLEIIKIESTVSPMPYGDRSNVLIQPWLTKQWFLDVDCMSKLAIQAVQNGEVRFFPKSWDSTFFHWLNNIKPWCISRQLWWGHRIPAWYGPDGFVFVAKNEDQAKEKAKKHYGEYVSLEQDNDVLDTWFSSSLWPFGTLGFESDNLENPDSYFNKYFPTSVLVTGFDIIFFWVARMMMMSLHLLSKVPFKDIYVHTLVRDSKGQKMSKSKGNVIDPLDIIEKYGVDALRFTLSSLAIPARDIKLSTERIEGSRNFITKIRNAIKFLKMHELFESNQFSDHVLTNWIREKLNEMIKSVESNIDDYRFDLASSAIYQFFWYEFCDVYLESIKSLDDKKIGAYEILNDFLKVAYPFIPFIVQEFLDVQSWPKTKNIDIKNSLKVSKILKIVESIRSLKGLLGIKEKINLGCNKLSSENFINENWNWISHLSGLNDFIEKSSSFPIQVDKELFSESTVFLIPNESWDKKESLKILEKKQLDLEKEKIRLSKKLENLIYKEAKPDEFEKDEKLLISTNMELETLEEVIQRII